MRLVVNTTPRSIYPWECCGTHFVGGWVGPMAGLEGCGKFRPTRNESLYRPSYSTMGRATLEWCCMSRCL
jgi:hypothetical protein